MLKTFRKPQLFISLLLLLFVLLTGCQQTPVPQDPSSPQPTPNADLVFEPAEIAVAPGNENSVSVSVTTGADLSKAIFALEQAPEGVSLSFTPASDGKTGELFVALSETRGEGSQDLKLQGTDGEHIWLGTLRVTALTTAPVTRFVNPVSGNDANPGTSSQPFKTLAKAVTKVKAGDTIRLAAGGYSKTLNGEQFPVQVPSGVTIRGTLDRGSLATTLFGEGSGVGLDLAGDATVRDLSIGGGFFPGAASFSAPLSAKQGKQTFINLFVAGSGNKMTIDGVEANAGIVLRGTANATLLADSSQGFTAGSTVFVRGEAEGVDVSGQAQFTMKSNTGMIVKNDFAEAMFLSDSAKVTLNNSILRLERGKGFFMKGSAQATLINTSIGLLSNADSGQRAIIATEKTQVMLDGGEIDGGSPNCVRRLGLQLENSAKATLKNGVTLTNLSSGALQMNDTSSAFLDHAKIDITFLGADCGNQFAIDTRDSALLTVQNSTITGVGSTAFSFGISASSFLPLTIVASTISGFSHCGVCQFGHGIVSITGSTLSNNNFGIDTGSGDDVGTIFVSDSTLIANNRGMRGNFIKLRNNKVIGNNVGVDAQGVGVDLGTLADPGNNTITNNNRGVTFIKSSSVVGFVSAVGNTWNAGIQGADGNGHYTTHFVATPKVNVPTGTNFDFFGFGTPNPEDKIQF
jgi:hypothetical protein